MLYLQKTDDGGCTSIHFGENQLSPCSIGISPLPTSPPPVLQHWWVRASTKFHLRFTLLMGSSHGFGSHRRHRRALHTRLPYGSPSLAKVNQATPMHSPDHSTKGTPLALTRPRREWPLTAGKDRVSGTLSSPSRGAFHLSLTVLVHYRSLWIGSLGGWSPLLPTRLHVSRGTQDPDPLVPRFLYGTLTRSGQAFQPVQVLCTHMMSVLQPRPFLRRNGLGCSRFARHYSGHLG